MLLALDQRGQISFCRSQVLGSVSGVGTQPAVARQFTHQGDPRPLHAKPMCQRCVSAPDGVSGWHAISPGWHGGGEPRPISSETPTGASPGPFHSWRQARACCLPTPRWMSGSDWESLCGRIQLFRFCKKAPVWGPSVPSCAVSQGHPRHTLWLYTQHMGMRDKGASGPLARKYEGPGLGHKPLEVLGHSHIQSQNHRTELWRDHVWAGPTSTSLPAQTGRCSGSCSGGPRTEGWAKT